MHTTIPPHHPPLTRVQAHFAHRLQGAPARDDAVAGEVTEGNAQRPDGAIGAHSGPVKHAQEQRAWASTHRRPPNLQRERLHSAPLSPGTVTVAATHTSPRKFGARPAAAATAPRDHGPHSTLASTYGLSACSTDTSRRPRASCTASVSRAMMERHVTRRDLPWLRAQRARRGRGSCRGGLRALISEAPCD